MVIKKIIEKTKAVVTKKKEKEEIEATIPTEELRINIKVDGLKNFSDTERILQMLRDGSIVILKIKDLRDRDISELKKAVDKLKRTCAAMDGDIVGVDEDYLIITPSYAKIYRGKG